MLLTFLSIVSRAIYPILWDILTVQIYRIWGKLTEFPENLIITSKLL